MKKRKAIKQWVAASRRNAALVVIAAVVLFSGAAAGLAASPMGNMTLPDDIDVEPVDNYFLVDKEEFGDVLLEKTADAGQAYQNETLFIGDSNTLRMYMFQQLTLENMIGIESLGIIGAREYECVYFEGQSKPVTMVEAIKMMKPRRVVICLGTNDLPYTKTEDFIENYSEFIDEIRAAYPYTDVIISAVPPFAAKMEGSLKLSKLNEYNVGLVELGREKQVKFLDIGEALTGSNGYIKPEYIYSDGIHITEAASTAWLKYARTHAYLTEDRRPQPLGTIPKQKYVPVFYPGSGTGEKDEEFSLDKVVSSTMMLLRNSGFSAASQGEDMTSAKTYTYKQAATLEPGAEESLARTIYQDFLNSSGITGGTVSMSYTETDEMWTFTILYKEHVHTVDETKWVTAKEATCKEEGKKTNTCLTCGKKVEETIPKKDHTWDAGVVLTDPTCTTEGTKKYTCTVCGETKEEAIPALGHDWDGGVVTTDPNCVTPGEKTSTCTVCNTTKTDVIPPTGVHNGNPCADCGYSSSP